jgi:hypothetical protein
VRFQQNALRYLYQARNPEKCAMSHNNLANHLQRANHDDTLTLAHRHAAGTIFLQIGSGQLAITIRNLAQSPVPASPPTFAEVTHAVEQIEGVQFAKLFARLPKRYSDGDAAVAALWELVQQEKAKPTPGPQMPRMVRGLEPYLRVLAAAAHNEAARPELAALLRQMEQLNWQIAGPVARIWVGERDAASLTSGIDGNSARLVGRILELVSLTSQEEVLASMPPAIQTAFELDGDAVSDALNAALEALPGEEAGRVFERLEQAGLVR